ncbi:hypothetical protein NBRC116602_07410 [Hyphomicrobiales bacterium 4NK60-0047b]|jgi:glycosyltransferase involved in cell wall biosynthesis
MLVSYVVTFYNKFEFISSLISSIETQEGNFEKQLIIADDCSAEAELAQLKDFVAGYDLFPIKIISSSQNTGPAQCFNRGLEAVDGGVVIAIDADDVFVPSATSYYLEQMQKHSADFIYGRRRKRDHKKNDKTEFEVIDNPLDYVIKNNIVHMCFAAKTDVLRGVGGADPRLFIQDQSLPLRLASGAKRMVRSEVVTVYINSDEDGLSKNVAQQHYDRFWMVMNFLSDHSDLSQSIRAALKDIARSSLWKMDRDKGSFKFTSPHFWTYIWGRLTGVSPTTETLKLTANQVFEGEVIRRVEN